MNLKINKIKILKIKSLTRIERGSKKIVDQEKLPKFLKEILIQMKKAQF